MPSKSNSPYASSFKTAIKRGTPCGDAVASIAKRYDKNPKTVFASLHKVGLCFRQKFNGQWIYWPCEAKKTTSANFKPCQLNMWQCFIDWCITSGSCTPQQLLKHCKSQKDFMSYCRKFFNKQFAASTGSGSGKAKRRTTGSGRKSRPTAAYRSRTTSLPKRRSTSRRTSRSAGYPFPRASRSRATRQYRKVA